MWGVSTFRVLHSVVFDITLIIINFNIYIYIYTHTHNKLWFIKTTDAFMLKIQTQKDKILFIIEKMAIVVVVSVVVVSVVVGV